MTRWAMVIDLDKCVACQGCSIACRQENNTPAVSPEEAANGAHLSLERRLSLSHQREEAHGEYPNVTTRYMTRPCMHCDNAPCAKVCPVQATYRDEEGLMRQDYERCIGCRFCTVACPYGVRHFNWEEPPWRPEMALAHQSGHRIGRWQSGRAGRAPQGRGGEVHLLYPPAGQGTPKRRKRKNVSSAPRTTCRPAYRPVRPEPASSAIWTIPTAVSAFRPRVHVPSNCWKRSAHIPKSSICGRDNLVLT